MFNYYKNVIGPLRQQFKKRDIFSGHPLLGSYPEYFTVVIQDENGVM